MDEALEIEPGQIFTTPSKTLTDAHFLFFSGLTGDNHPIHYDVEYAKTPPLRCTTRARALTRFNDSVGRLERQFSNRWLHFHRAGKPVSQISVGRRHNSTFHIYQTVPRKKEATEA